MFTFSSPTRVSFGDGALSALDALAGKRILIVTDHFLSHSGMLEKVTDRLAGSPITVFDRVTPDPTLELVAEGVAIFRSVDPEAVVAFGGGSPMDCAKAMKFFAAEQSPPGGDCPLFCVPTTAGTGSEVTSFAVLTDGAKGVKHPLVDPALLPQAAILDPSFLAGVPPKVTADTGMDVLTHAAEAYVAQNATPFTDALARAAFVKGYRALPLAYRGDGAAKGELLVASTMAGLAFNAAGLGICHALAHTIGGKYHLPHGQINAILLPHVIRFNAAASAARTQTAETVSIQGKYGELAAACGLAATGRSLSFGLARLAASVGEPARFAEKLDRTAIAAAALRDPCAATNPRVATDAALAALLREVG